MKIEINVTGSSLANEDSLQEIKEKIEKVVRESVKDTSLPISSQNENNLDYKSAQIQIESVLLQFLKVGSSSFVSLCSEIVINEVLAHLQIENHSNNPIEHPQNAYTLRHKAKHYFYEIYKQHLNQASTSSKNHTEEKGSEWKL